MSVPPLHLSNNFESYMSGEVTIHPSAVIAPGVILQAAVNSKIIIGPGVCIGMGSILQVSAGTIEVEAGANLGAGFLMVGEGTIGANACIGSATTVFNSSIDPGAVISPGSILGDSSRRIEETPEPESATDNGADTTTDASTQPQPEAEQSLEVDEETPTSSTHVSASTYWKFKHQSTVVASESSPTTNSQPPPPPENPEPDNSIPEEPAASQPLTESSPNFGNHIYGQVSINRLLATIFPHRQTLNEPISDDSSEKC